MHMLRASVTLLYMICTSLTGRLHIFASIMHMSTYIHDGYFWILVHVEHVPSLRIRYVDDVSAFELHMSQFAYCSGI